ncbi:hypothetical protein ACIO53_38465 [Streptomyces sp. NPDC087305]|uniref:hypothetical protein n=1 Tax=Streptomyces sp. NPDC087305 TaxID=3365781 RepID=UPI00381EF728
MSAGGRLTALARTRITYTGEPYQFALEALKNARTPTPLPDSTGDQALLESQVLSKLGDGGSWSAHPTGIANVRLSPGRPIVVHLDSHVGLSQGGSCPVAWHALDRLLPYASTGIQVDGVLGLRIGAIRGRDLHLTLAETESRLIIRGVPGTTWEDYLDERWDDLVRLRAAPLWRSPSFSDLERRDEQSHPLVRGAEKDIAWAGAGLLRRIALFHTSSSAYSTRSWISGSEWIFELDTRHGIRLDHDTLLARLTDPVWGMPLRVVKHHCTCDDPPLEHDWYMRQCTYELAHSDGPRCGLQFRFRWGRAAYGKDARKQLERLGADVGWLDRVLPGDTRGSRGEATP